MITRDQNNHNFWIRLASLLVAEAFFCSSLPPAWALPSFLSTLRPTSVTSAKDGGKALNDIEKDLGIEKTAAKDGGVSDPMKDLLQPVRERLIRHPEDLNTRRLHAHLLETLAKKSEASGDNQRAIIYFAWAGAETSWLDLSKPQTAKSLEKRLDLMHYVLTAAESAFPKVEDGPFLFEGLIRSVHSLLERQLQQTSAPELTSLYRASFLELSDQFGRFLEAVERPKEARDIYFEARGWSEDLPNAKAFFETALLGSGNRSQVANDGGHHRFTRWIRPAAAQDGGQVGKVGAALLTAALTLAPMVSQTVSAGQPTASTGKAQGTEATFDQTTYLLSVLNHYQEWIWRASTERARVRVFVEKILPNLVLDFHYGGRTPEYEEGIIKIAQQIHPEIGQFAADLIRLKAISGENILKISDLISKLNTDYLTKPEIGFYLSFLPAGKPLSDEEYLLINSYEIVQRDKERVRGREIEILMIRKIDPLSVSPANSGSSMAQEPFVIVRLDSLEDEAESLLRGIRGEQMLLMSERLMKLPDIPKTLQAILKKIFPTASREAILSALLTDVKKHEADHKADQISGRYQHMDDPRLISESHAYLWSVARHPDPAVPLFDIARTFLYESGRGGGYYEVKRSILNALSRHAYKEKLVGEARRLDGTSFEADARSALAILSDLVDLDPTQLNRLAREVLKEAIVAGGSVKDGGMRIREALSNSPSPSRMPLLIHPTIDRLPEFSP